jgi:hypothetical protein
VKPCLLLLVSELQAALPNLKVLSWYGNGISRCFLKYLKVIKYSVKVCCKYIKELVVSGKQ